MIAAATNKPIIYCNIGKRHTSDYTRTLLKKRCLWLDVDIDNPGNLIERAQELSHVSFSNSITSEYSMCNTPSHTKREDQLINLAHRIAHQHANLRDNKQVIQ